MSTALSPLGRASTRSASRSRPSRGSRRGGSATASAAVSTAAAAALADGDIGRPRAEVALSRDDLVVVGAEAHTRSGPGGEVVGHGHGAAGSLGATNGPELREGRRALNAGLVHALSGVEVVGVAVGDDGALGAGALGGVSEGCG